MTAGPRALVDLEPRLDGDPDPGSDRRIHAPVGDDAEAVGRPGPDRPAEPMSKRRTEAVGDGNDASSNFGSRGDHRRAAIVAGPDIAGFGLRAELDVRIVAERLDQSRVEREPPDAESGLLAVVLRKGHGHRWLLGEPELDSREGRRTTRCDIILEAQLS